MIDGRAAKSGISRPAEEDTMLMVLNSFDGAVDFTMPETVGGKTWSLLVDTNLAEPPAREDFAFGDIYLVTGRSLLLFVLNR